MVPLESRSKHFRKRDAILAYLRQTDEHPSAEAVYAGLKTVMPDVSLGTVYRNLALFKEQGLIQSLGSVRGVERFDGNIEPHVHFICSNCDAVMDMHQIPVPTQLGESCTGCRVESCQLTFTGLCSNCQD
jgi:Fur family peroxide stress response transcriptional regulator